MSSPNIPPHSANDPVPVPLAPAAENFPGGWLALTFRSFRHRNYRLYFFGQLISMSGSHGQTMALHWLAYELTRESRWPAFLIAAQVLPTFLLGAWAGALADHFSKRALIFWSQTALLSLSILLTILVWSGATNPWLLLAVALGIGLVQAVDFPARLAFVMDMVGRDDLVNAVALNSVLFNLARILGPSLGAPILYFGGAAACFLANSCTYPAILLALVAMDPRTLAARVQPSRPRLLAGFHFLVVRVELLVLVILVGVVAFCGWPFLALLPAFADHVLHLPKRAYSLMLASTGIGAMLAALIVAALGRSDRQSRFALVGVTLVSTALVALSAASSLYLAALCCMLIGFGLILFLSTSQAAVQLSAGDDNRGQVMGVYAMVISGAVPFGNLVIGPAADRWGEPNVLAAQGLVCAGTAAALTLLLLAWKAWIRRAS